MGERERMDLDVLFVGAGPASLAGTYHLLQLVKQHNGAHPDGKLEPAVAVVEKGAAVGNLGLSGGVLDPRAMRELMSDFRERGMPIEAEVASDEVRFFTKGSAFKLPFNPPPLDNHGNFVVSLAAWCAWMGQRVEEAGGNIFTGFAAGELLYEGDRVVGVRTGDKGIAKDGAKRPNFEPGIDLAAKVTILGEGPRGTLAKRHIARLRLDEGKNPQVYGTGVKEVWKVRPEKACPGRVIHTLGFPADADVMGGGFIYGMSGNRLSLGYVTWLNYKDPSADPHGEFHLWKTHPFIRDLLEGGEIVQYGAKTIPEGGYFSVPRLYSDGLMLVGDTAGMVNVMRLKGIHLAMKSGMLAAETAFAALKAGDASEKTLAAYQEAYEKSWISEELKTSRNFHSYFDHGLFAGVVRNGLAMLFGGRLLADRLPGHPDHETLRKGDARERHRYTDLAWDNKTFLFDKVTDVFHSGTQHEENQPPHLLVADDDLCRTRCAQEYGNPCVNFCPANVYEMEGEGSARHLKLNAANCVHCKTCDIKDPYGIITWVPPEGGGGPRYSVL